MPVGPKNNAAGHANGNVRVAVPPVDDCLRPFAFHGVDISIRGAEGVADCPLCGREGKWYVSTDTSQWSCKVCGASGNALTFLQQLWDRSDAATPNDALRLLAEDRGLLDQSTLVAWGACQSVVDRCWLVPGYDARGKLCQLYRRVRTMKKPGEWSNLLLPTPGVWPDGRVHALHMASMSFDATKPNLWLTEGPWDGMALWEVARQCKRGASGDLEFTGSEASSLLHDTNVVSVPGCNVFNQDWLALCRGKSVTLMYDSDHPRLHCVPCKKTWSKIDHDKCPNCGGPLTGPEVSPSGYDGMRRAAKLLSGVASEVKWLKWSDDGYDSGKPSGYDVRDLLTGK